MVEAVVVEVEVVAAVEVEVEEAVEVVVVEEVVEEEVEVVAAEAVVGDAGNSPGGGLGCRHLCFLFFIDGCGVSF